MALDRQGLVLVSATALISGVSVFANAWAVKGFDSTVFTFSKNVLVAVLLTAFVLGLGAYQELRTLSRRQWFALVGIGFVGGAVPFVLFFAGLQLAGASLGQFIHKLLFVFASVGALLVLRERLNTGFVLGAALILAGNAVLLAPSLSWSLGLALVLGATLFWAAENVWAKRVLHDVSGTVVAWARMFFGSLFLFVYVVLTGKAGLLVSMSAAQYAWIGVTSVFLLGYVLTFYSGLARVPVSVATSVLALAVPVTMALQYLFADAALTMLDVVGMGLLLAGVASVLYLSALVRSVKVRFGVRDGRS